MGTRDLSSVLVGAIPRTNDDHPARTDGLTPTTPTVTAVRLSNPTHRNDDSGSRFVNPSLAGIPGWDNGEGARRQHVIERPRCRDEHWNRWLSPPGHGAVTRPGVCSRSATLPGCCGSLN